MSFWDFMSKTYSGGIIFIVLGLIIIKLVSKYPQKKDEAYQYDIKYWASGITFLVIGLSVIIAKLLGKA